MLLVKGEEDEGEEKYEVVKFKIFMDNKEVLGEVFVLFVDLVCFYVCFDCGCVFVCCFMLVKYVCMYMGEWFFVCIECGWCFL